MQRCRNCMANRSKTTDTQLSTTSRIINTHISEATSVMAMKNESVSLWWVLRPCRIVDFKNHAYMNAWTVKRYFELAQKCPDYCDTSYALDWHVISNAFLLIRVANRSFSCRLLHATLSYVRFSVVVYKSFHDIGLENCNWISENASCSIQWSHKSRDFCVRVTNRRQ